MALRLVREPGNKFDPNAVAVWITARSLVFFASEVQIGYINADLARELAPLTDRGTPVGASISDVTGGTGAKALGGNILVTRGCDGAMRRRRAVRILPFWSRIEPRPSA